MQYIFLESSIGLIETDNLILIKNAGRKYYQ